MKTPLLTAVAVAVLALAGACGDSDPKSDPTSKAEDKRPSASDISEALSADDADPFEIEGYDEVADCIAEAIYDSKLSDDEVQNIVDGQEYNIDEVRSSFTTAVVCQREGRPTSDELADTFESQSSDSLPIDRAGAECMAGVLLNSAISDETLRDIADEMINITGLTVSMPSSDIEAWQAITDDVVACLA
ncbi:MAG: hypothetical protein QM597_09875 [Aeromicrobium sp.]|uniref:hypothetical protein n=1 Tax=Aeromicrobium sp. TaxID=1871063 RepID=UPI0039E5032A